MVKTDEEEVYRGIVADLRRSRRLLFITGAGVSADSGLPTYRGIGGLYENGETEEGMAIEDALSGETLREFPHITWKYLGRIEAACRNARCNDAHRIIAAFQDAFEHVCVLTQNIDGFHRQAGSRNLVEIHGDVHDLTCTACSYRTRVPDYAGLDLPPRCPDCGAPVRPRVVLFGEILPLAEIEHLQEELRRGVDLVFSIGTTSVFHYIAGPVVAACRAGIPTVEINPGETCVSGLVKHRLRAGAAEALREIARRLGQAWSNE